MLSWTLAVMVTGFTFATGFAQGIDKFVIKSGVVRNRRFALLFGFAL